MPRGIPEATEYTIGSTLNERNTLLNHMPANTLGPLDLCSTRKVGTSSLIGAITGGMAESGYYHRVAGSDVSSIAAISAYFFDLVNRQSTSSVWNEGGSLQLRGGVFCVWNPFANVDLRVEFSYPGEVDYLVYTRDGRVADEVEVDAEFWEQIMLASSLRALSVLQNRGLHVHCDGPVRASDPLNSVASVAVMTELVVEHFSDAEATGCPSEHIDPSEKPSSTCMMSLIFTHLSNSGRYGEGLAIMGACVKEDSLVMTYVTSLSMKMSTTPKKAMELLCTAIQHETLGTSRWSSLVASQLTLLLSAEPTREDSSIDDILNENEDELFVKDWYSWKGVVLELARSIVKVKPFLYSAWLLLAKAYVAVGMYPDALVALNSAPLRQTNTQFDDFFVASPGLSLAGWTFDLAFDDVTEIGNFFSNSHDVTTNWPLFTILVRIYTMIGWNELLGLRAQVFLTDVDAKETGEKEEEEEEVEE